MPRKTSESTSPSNSKETLRTRPPATISSPPLPTSKSSAFKPASLLALRTRPTSHSTRSSSQTHLNSRTSRLVSRRALTTKRSRRIQPRERSGSTRPTRPRGRAHRASRALSRGEERACRCSRPVVVATAVQGAMTRMLVSGQRMSQASRKEVSSAIADMAAMPSGSPSKTNIHTTNSERRICSPRRQFEY